jgi:hypothetical protein
MFCIHKNKLWIAKTGIEDSHATWFLKEGWISLENDELMNKIVRGYLNNKNEVYFYTGYNFEINPETEKIFFAFLDEIKFKLKLNNNTRFFGGMIKPKKGKIWKPVKEYSKEDLKVFT